ncbi:hypothetical protein T440DRAFT_479826 [Plenodomus tracheiphilus IPT5]|uniref:Uncharacterized protein n=1 Tax=Plenodomus tracheiphilus IPT5 TaxID=1408161 RepID=A0A6A7B2A2_9PLEO|nr:hypothetical protein T440DRAFT_479826 [Plenodomus tracheiphilus IPT5]
MSPVRDRRKPWVRYLQHSIEAVEAGSSNILSFCTIVQSLEPQWYRYYEVDWRARSCQASIDLGNFDIGRVACRIVACSGGTWDALICQFQIVASGIGSIQGDLELLVLNSHVEDLLGEIRKSILACALVRTIAATVGEAVDLLEHQWVRPVRTIILDEIIDLASSTSSLALGGAVVRRKGYRFLPIRRFCRFLYNFNDNGLGIGTTKRKRKEIPQISKDNTSTI